MIRTSNNKEILALPISKTDKFLRVFIQSIGHGIIASIKADSVLGELRLIRNDETTWIVLENSLDMKAIYSIAGSNNFELKLDLEKAYQSFLVDGIIAGDVT